MKFLDTIPVIISVLVGFLLGFVMLGLLQLRQGRTPSSSSVTNDALLLALLSLAAFAMGVFLTYVLVGLLV